MSKRTKIELLDLRKRKPLTDEYIAQNANTIWESSICLSGSRYPWDQMHKVLEECLPPSSFQTTKASSVERLEGELSAYGDKCS